jgi:hypothetical protein
MAQEIKEHLDCLHERDWGTLWQIIKEHTAHVLEGDKSGGFRDRLIKIEMDLKALKERFWQSSLIGGVIGAILGSGSREGIALIIKMFTKT